MMLPMIKAITEFEHSAVAFFGLQSGLKLALWNRKDIAYDTKMDLKPASPTDFTIGHNLGSKEEVDMVMKQAEKAVRLLYFQFMKPFGVDTLDTSRTQTVIYWSVG
jgi:uncharacterized protein